MHKKHIIAGLTAAALLLPAAAFAQTSVEAQAKSLMAQIQALQLQLKMLLASSTPATRVEIRKEDMGGNRLIKSAPGQAAKARCIMLNRNLRVGSEGEDVKKLQEMLAEDKESGFRGKATGFYGPLTANAMAKFQVRAGITTTTDGTVGEMTRGFFERECGKGLGMMEMNRAEIKGTISAVAGNTITVAGLKGGSRTIMVNASTTIRVRTGAGAPTAGTTADLVVGTLIEAEGTPQADGSLIARKIKIGSEDDE